MDQTDRKNKQPHIPGRPEGKWLNKNDLDKQIKKFKEDDYEQPFIKEKL